MRRYNVFEHDEEVWRNSHGFGFMSIMDDLLGPINLGSRMMGSFLLATDSRSRKARRGESVRFAVPRSSIDKHGVMYSDVVEMLNKLGVRTRTVTHDSRWWYFTVRGTQAKQAIAAVEAWKAGKAWKPWKGAK